NVNGNDNLKWNGNKQRQKRDTTAGKRRSQGVQPLGNGGGANSKLGAGAGNNKRAGDQGGARAKAGGVGDPQAARTTPRQSNRGTQSPNSGSSAGATKKLQPSRNPAGGQSVTKQRQGGGGAFGGQAGGGKRAGAQSKRGNQSMQGVPKRRR